MQKYKNLNYLALALLFLFLNVSFFGIPVLAIAGLSLFTLVLSNLMKNGKLNKELQIGFILIISSVFITFIFNLLTQNGLKINIDTDKLSALAANNDTKEIMKFVKEFIDSFIPVITFAIIVTLVKGVLSCVKVIGFYFVGISYKHYYDNRLPLANETLVNDITRQSKKLLTFGLISEIAADILTILSLLFLKTIVFDEDNMIISYNKVLTIIVVILSLIALVCAILYLIAFIKYLIYIFNFKRDFINGDPIENNEDNKGEETYTNNVNEDNKNNNNNYNDEYQDDINRYRYEDSVDDDKRK